MSGDYLSHVDRKYDIGDKTYMEDTFDHIKAIKWHWDIKQN